MARGPQENRSTILVVDDNEGNRALAEATLADEGYRVVLAGGGEEGITAFEREQPDCVILDVRMPDVDGFGVCERIREAAKGADTPVLFLTALRDVETFDRALTAGADDFLTKPVRPGELVVRVKTALRLRRASEEARELHEALRRQRDELVRLQLQKERLVAFVVHDLKNPVNSMDLHAQLLARDKALPEAAREAAGQIRSEARQLNRMLVNLLDISKADEGRLEARKDRVSVGALVDETFAELELNARDRKVSLEARCDEVWLNADEDLLHRVLANLVDNALRHSPPGARVVLSVALHQGGVLVRVEDAGPGIPTELRARIFEPFVQLDRGDRSRAGRGLGLTFCKLVAEAHGGRIWVEPKEPGSAFCLWLPE